MNNVSKVNANDEHNITEITLSVSKNAPPSIFE